MSHPTSWRAVVIQKPDLDTCLAGLLLGAERVTDLRVVRDLADPVDLRDPAVLCLECGGSGAVVAGNFDHHDTTEALPPACVQALATVGGDAATRRLVAYVAAIDTAALPPAVVPPPYLSGVFAGMLLRERDPAARFRSGLTLLRRALDLGLDPFDTMPAQPEWRDWIAAKEKNDAGVRAVAAAARILTTGSGRTLGYVETTFYGALGALYAQGCDVAVAYNPRFGDPPAPKFTIGTRGLPLDDVRAALVALEPGWGGPAHGTVLGSPRAGSRLGPDAVLTVLVATL